MIAKGYSLWLMPEGEEFAKSSSLISILANQYDTQSFDPHVTLLGEIIGEEKDIIQRTENLVRHSERFTVAFETISFESYYFRALFIKVKPHDILFSLHLKAKNLFHKQDSISYMPHMSLLYGNLLSSEKEKIIKKISIPFSSFPVNTISLYKTTGEPKEWYSIQDFAIPSSE